MQSAFRRQKPIKEHGTVRRNSSNLPIKGHIVANQDPPKNQLSALQAHLGLLV